MSKVDEKWMRISRRDSLKGAFAIPVGALTATRWLAGCASQENAAAPLEQTTAAGKLAPSPGGTVSAPSVPTSGGAGGIAASAVNRPVAASSSAASAPVGGGAAGMPSAAGSAAGSPAAGSNAPLAANAGMSASPPAGGMMTPAAGSGGMIATPPPGWAAGGTKSMKGPYPDPFAMGMGGAACKLYPAQTLGPCYTQGPAMREDISDGAKGLPTRLSLLVVRANGCTPIAGATVDIWHSGFDGVYSAYGSGVCNPDSLDVRDQMFCRGVQTTDEAGRVNFSTIFPGWYSSRSVHIHFTVRVNGMGVATSQLYFEDPLTTEIQAQGEYAARGMRSTTNANDFIFRSGGASAQDVLMLTAKRADGSLHAWKVLAVG